MPHLLQTWVQNREPALFLRRCLGAKPFSFSLVLGMWAIVGSTGSLVQAKEVSPTDQATRFAQLFLVNDDLIGSAIIWLLLLMSALSLGYALSLMLRYRRNVVLPQKTREEIEVLLAEKCYREAIDYAHGDPSFLGQLVSAALGEAGLGFEAMQRAVAEEGDVQTSRMLRPVEYLNVVGNLAPMMGLFGTVYGMIMAFGQLVAAGGKPNPVELAGGISTSLVTTFWGLVVAIPALAAYAIVRNKIDALTSEGIVQAEQLIRPFKPGIKKAEPISPSPRPRSIS